MAPSIPPPKSSLQLRKHRHASALSTTPLKGDNADDYTTPVYIDGQGPFSLNVDTGSALVGVAGKCVGDFATFDKQLEDTYLDKLKKPKKRRLQDALEREFVERIGSDDSSDSE